MPYTLGTVHAITGSGSVAIAQPAGLAVAVSGIPAGVTETFSTPPQFFDIGTVTPGNADGYLEPIRLSHALSLLYPLPDSLTVLGYDLPGGASAFVTELLAVPVNPHAGLLPVDRNGSMVQVTFSGTVAGGTLTTTACTYTVPAGKWLQLEGVHLVAWRATIATTPGLFRMQANVGVNPILHATDTTANTMNDLLVADLAQPMMLPAGSVLTSTYRDAEVGGTWSMTQTLTGLLFDA